MILNIVIFVPMIVFFIWLAYHVIKMYRSTEGTKWERLLAGFRDSATVLLAGSTAIAGAITSAIVEVAEAANFPEVAEAVRSLPSEYVGYGLIALAGLTFVARMRSLGKE